MIKNCEQLENITSYKYTDCLRTSKFWEGKEGLTSLDRICDLIEDIVLHVPLHKPKIRLSVADKLFHGLLKRTGPKTEITAFLGEIVVNAELTLLFDQKTVSHLHVKVLFDIDQNWKLMINNEDTPFQIDDNNIMVIPLWFQSPNIFPILSVAGTSIGVKRKGVFPPDTQIKFLSHIMSVGDRLAIGSDWWTGKVGKTDFIVQNGKVSILDKIIIELK